MLPLAHHSCLQGALCDALIAYKSNTALVEANRYRQTHAWSFKELRSRVLAFAGALQLRGLKPGERVAIVMSNQSRWLVAATAVFWSGGVLVPLDYKLTAREQLSLLEHCDAPYLVTEWASWRKLREIAPTLAQSRVCVVAELPDAQREAGAIEFDAFADERAELRPRDRDDVATIVYSSGTGGTPKGCMLTHGNYLAQAESLGGLYPMNEEDHYFSILPTNHAIDFMCGFLMPLLFGATIVHQRTLRPEFLSWTMKEYGVSHMALVPRILTALEERIRERLDELSGWRRAMVDALIGANEVATRREPNHALSARLLGPIHAAFGGRLRYVFAGGAFVERSTAEFFYRIGIPVAIGYGLTEAGTVLTVNDLKPFRPDTVGRPVPGVQLELRDVGPDGVGEVWVSSDTVMKGYLDEPGLTAEAIVDGWLRTGDLGVLDAAGHLKLVGRAKNVIVTSGGKNVYPENVESSFDGIEGVEELAVFASNFIWRGEAPSADELVVVVRLEEGADPRAVKSALERRNHGLSEYKRIRSVVWSVDEFPRTASLKIKRNALAERLRGRSHAESCEPVEERLARSAGGGR